METQTIERTEVRRVARTNVEDTVRELLAEAEVTRVTVSDTGGHALVEIPVRHDITPLLMDAAVSAAGAIAERVGDVVLSVEKEPALTPRSGGGAQTVRASMGAHGGEPAQQASSDQQRANVTQADIERIREANAVPTGSEEAVERLEPEQRGDPKLKDTSTPYSPRQRGRKDDRPSR